MSEIQYPPITEILKKRFQAHTLTTLADQIVPVVQLEGTGIPPEYEYLRNTQLCMGANPAGFSETNSSDRMQVMLSNPAASRTLLVVEAVHGLCQIDPISAGNSPSVPLVLIAAAGLGDLHLMPHMRDFRWNIGGSRAGVGQIRTLAAAVSSGTFMGRARGTFAVTQGTTVTKQGFDFMTPVVISPGNALSFEVPALAGSGIVTTFQVHFSWREYLMSAWELQASNLG